jgi:glutathione S-transferase
MPGKRRSLMPAALPQRQHSLHQIGLALAACEKSVSIMYERNLRPAEKLHQPWLDRLTAQLLAAFRLLEADVATQPLAAGSQEMNQAGVSVAVAWHFTQQTLAEFVPAADFPALRDFSSGAERLPEFIAAPHGADTYRG